MVIDLLEIHKPIIYYHPNEKYFIDDPVDYFNKTEPIFKEDGTACHRKAPSMYLYDWNDKKKLYKIRDRKTKLPYDYAMYKERENVIAKQKVVDGKIYLSYLVFFPYNGNKRVAGVFPTGAHWADLEEFHVVLDATTRKVLYYILSSHGDGNIYNKDPNGPKLELNGTNPIIYASVNSHAFYGAPGSYVRFGGAGNDNTKKGKKFIPNIIEYEKNSVKDVIEWKGKLGPDGINPFSARFTEKGIPTITDKIKPHFTRVPEIIMFLPYLLWFILPFIIFVYFGSNRDSLIMAGITLPLQMNMFRCILKLFGSKFGLEMDKKALKDEMDLNIFKLY